MSRPLRIAMFVGSFPEVSETFILHQITGLLDLGHQVQIYANSKPEPGAPVHPEVDRYRLLERTTYINGPAESLDWDLPVWPLHGRTWPPGSATSIPNSIRLARALPKLLRCLATEPRLTLQTLDAREYGCQATSLSALYRLATLLAAAKQYDVLHAHFGPVANSFRFARSLWRAPLVVTFHGYDFCAVPREEGPNVYQHLFRTVDAVTVNSEYTRAKVIELGCAAQRIHSLHVGLNLDQFRFRDRVRHPNEPVRILSVGRLVEKKGIEYSIRAVASVRQKHPDLRYDIIGDGPLKPSLEQLISELGLGQNVTLHGSRDSVFVQERMAEAHLFMLTSVTAADGDQEGTPVSLMEAHASGLPVLSTRHSGIPEVVLDGASGFLLQERDVQGLAEKTHYLIEHPEICRAMGARGRQHVEDQFDIRKLNRDLAALYEGTAAAFHGTEKSPPSAWK
jgi:colanic acid/amylovoran biosynthesis glycosyltransferase